MEINIHDTNLLFKPNYFKEYKRNNFKKYAHTLQKNKRYSFREFFKDFIAGGIAGMNLMIITFPIE